MAVNVKWVGYTLYGIAYSQKCRVGNQSCQFQSGLEPVPWGLASWQSRVLP